MIRKFVIWFVVFASVNILNGQFYYGHQMNFGKNRVQYNNFYWSFFRYNDFDVYFNQNGKYLAEYTSDYLGKRIGEIETLLDYKLDKRMIFIVFNKLTDLRQTNIGLITGKDESNLGGVTTILKNKVFVYFNGDHQEYREQLDGAITQILLNELLFGSDIKENVTNTTLINLPDWYISGLVSYISKGWNIEIENIVKDGILTKKFKKFYHLKNEEAVLAGHSFWKYVADSYGQSIIPDILYLTRIYKNPNNGFQFSTGMKIKELSRDWRSYYLDYYKQQEERFVTKEGQPVYKRPKKKLVYHNMKINPTQNKFAYVTHKSGRYKIFIYDPETGKRNKVFQKGNNIEQITDYTFPAMAWHPTGRILTFITEEQGGLKLYYYNLENKEIISRNFLYFEKVLDYSFSEDGFKFVMSAVRNSQTDIFVYNLSSATSDQITNDIADDYNPRFVKNSSQIIFSSNRLTENLEENIEGNQTGYKTNVVHNLFLYDYAGNANTLKKLETEDLSNSIEPFEVEANKFVFLNDANGIVNRYVATFDSVISAVDTSIHYRYVTETAPLTNYFRNIEEQYIANNQKSEIVINKGRDFMFVEPTTSFGLSRKTPLPTTDFRSVYAKKLREQDSLNHLVIRQIPIDEIKDSLLVLEIGDTVKLETWNIDINNYVFEREKINYYNQKLKGKNVLIVQDTMPPQKPRIRIYQTAFYPNYLVNQIDFQNTNTSYQVFTGGAVYYNPDMNLLFKLGTNDLFEDYRLTLGYRFTIDFEGNEYLVSFENLKSRLDKQFIYHRQAFKNVNDEGEVFRVQTNEGMYVLNYPFSQVFSLRGTAKLRLDKGVYLSIDDKTLARPNLYSFWTGFKTELVFDNTRSLGMNLYSGSRWKAFGEAYFRVDDDFSDLFVVGMDYRYYVPIHRSLIWAFRAAGSSSFGHNKLIYYLGSLDNWTNLTPLKVPTFDQTVPVNNRERYAFQTTATNLRGFSQNIRNGNNFALINMELRWPIIRYLANRPVASSFLNNLQLAGFFDVGSAWQGLTPYSGKNAYDKSVFGGDNNPVTVTIDSNREPIVAGYGFGARTMLLGYFMRFDWAWGFENKTILPRVFYFSLNLDF